MTFIVTNLPRNQLIAFGLPKELLDALDMAKANGLHPISQLLETAIDKLMYGEKTEMRVDVTDKVEVHIQTCARASDGQIVSAASQRYVLDPQQVSCNQNQQYERKYGEDGEVVALVKLGKPYLVLQGVVDNIQSDSIDVGVDSKDDVWELVSVSD